PELLPTLLERGFQDVGIVPTQLFAYKAQFFSLGGGVKFGVGVGAYAFDVHLRRLLVINGLERPPPAGDIWKQQPRERKELFGGFGDIGMSVDVLPLRVGGASNLLSEVPFSSCHDISQAEFNRASFYVIS